MKQTDQLKKGCYYTNGGGRLYHVLEVNSSYALVVTGGSEIEISPYSELTELSELQVQAVNDAQKARRAATKARRNETLAANRAAMQTSKREATPPRSTTATKPDAGKPNVRRKTMAEKVFGEYTATSVLRWVGSNVDKDLATRQATQAALAEMGVTVSPITVDIQVNAGDGGSRGPAAKLTRDHGKQLRAAIAEAKKALPKTPPKAAPKKKAAAKKATAKKPAAKKKVAKKPAAKKSTAKKPTAKKATKKTATPAREPITKESQTRKRTRKRKTTTKADS